MCLLTLIILLGLLLHNNVFSETTNSTPPSPAKDENVSPPIELPDYQVITLSYGERIYSRKGKVEKIEIEGLMANPSMPLEFIACAEGGKDYESLVVLKCKPWNIHLALILAGLKEGKGPKSFGDPVKPTGDLVMVFISWEKPASPSGGDNKIVSYRVEDLIVDSQTKKPLEYVGWSFTGSMFVDDIDYDSGKPTGRKIYLADAYKNIIASWHDPAAVLNIPTQGCLYLPNKEILPPRGTNIKMIIRPPDAKELEELKKVNAQVSEREEKERKKQEEQKMQKEPK